MTASGDQEKLIFSMLAEIRSDIRQIRHDLQLLLDERQKPTMPASSPDRGDEADFFATPIRPLKTSCSIFACSEETKI